MKKLKNSDKIKVGSVREKVDVRERHNFIVILKVTESPGFNVQYAFFEDIEYKPRWTTVKILTEMSKEVNNFVE